MHYAEVRDRIKSGDMLLWSHAAGWNSRGDIETHIVRVSTESQWTHVGVAWVEHGRVWVMDITTRGCAPRLLSSDLPFWWIAAPRELTERGLSVAFHRFGEMTYSRWQAILARFKRLVVGADNKGQCAEYALEIWRADGMAPTEIATPYQCMSGAMERWPAASLVLVSD